MAYQSNYEAFPTELINMLQDSGCYELIYKSILSVKSEAFTFSYKYWFRLTP